MIGRGQRDLKKKVPVWGNQGRSNYLNHKTEYPASKMLIQVLRDLISLFVEVKIKLFDSKRFLIKWNFQLPCEHLVRAAIPRENHQHSLQGWRTSPTELCPWCWQERGPGAATSAHPTAVPRGSVLLAPCTSSSANQGFLQSCTWSLGYSRTQRKSTPSCGETGQGTKGSPGFSPILQQTSPAIPTHRWDPAAAWEHPSLREILEVQLRTR